MNIRFVDIFVRAGILPLIFREKGGIKATGKAHGN